MVLTPRGYMPRYVDRSIGVMLDRFGAIRIEGPRFCGKTWTSLNHANSSMMLSDPSHDYHNRRTVSMDPERAFTGERPHLIDEWQDIPALWDSARSRLTDDVVGGFILAGSSSPPRALECPSVGCLRMRSMSLYESGHSDGSVPLMSMFDGSFEPTDVHTMTIDRMIEMVIRGGMPRSMRLDREDARIINEGRYRRYLEDAAMLDGKARRMDKMDAVLRALARNECSTSSISRIASDIDSGTISDKSVINYIGVFDRLFLIEDQPAFIPRYRSTVRVRRSSKRHLTDPSIVVTALGLSPKMLERDLRTLAMLFESLCERDLDIYARSLGGRLYHYRDSDGREIDAVVELGDGRWGAFEIKLGANQIDQAAKNLIDVEDYMKDCAENPPSFLCVISGSSTSAYRRSDGVYVVPMTALRGSALR